MVAFINFNASADETIVFSDSFDNVLTDLTDEELRVEKFDGSLGTLLNVVVTIEASINTVGTITNESANNEQFILVTVAEEFNGELVNMTSPPLDDPLEAMENEVLFLGSFNLDPNESASFDETLTVNEELFAGLNAGFIGAGEFFGYDLTTQIQTLVSLGGGNNEVNQQTFASATLSVTYTFESEAVPEPNSIVLLGLASLTLLGFRKRK